MYKEVSIYQHTFIDNPLREGEREREKEYLVKYQSQGNIASGKNVA